MKRYVRNTSVVNKHSGPGTRSHVGNVQYIATHGLPTLHACWVFPRCGKGMSNHGKIVSKLMYKA
jgi:hypothetical protein